MMHKSKTRSNVSTNPLNRGSKRVARSVDTVLIEPNMLFREGLEHILASTQFHVVVKVDAVEALAVALRTPMSPTLFILQTSHDAQDTIDDVVKLKKRYPNSRVACIGQSYEPDDIVSLLRVGADALMLRSMSAAIFVKSLELVILGERIIPQEVLDITTGYRPDAPVSQATQAEAAAPACTQVREPAATESPYLASLSSREHDILRLLISGESNKIIAVKLLISEATVKVHIKAILRKIQVKNRTQAAIWALHQFSNDDIHRHASASNGNAGPIIIGELGTLERK